MRSTGEGGQSKDAPQTAAPAISLPKGGGAIRDIGEKFATNPVTGTGSMSVPIATSPGRSGFSPELSLTYDSGAGNGPFGFGWRLPLPSITRKTDKGLPRYDDAQESDVFILSGADDLVASLTTSGERFEDVDTAPGYTIRRYRPRIEGPFTRIERWTRDDGDVHWRSISSDNIFTLYGKDAGSRIADPEDPRRVFSWLICETRDDKGNAILYEYKPEDGAGIKLTCAHERNRGDADDPRRQTNRYLKRIRYGNRFPLLGGAGRRPRFLTDAANAGWMFEAVFDYGEHDGEAPKPDDGGLWNLRADPFSAYRAGFEVRTTRRCERLLMFHHFPDEEGVGDDCLVRSTDFKYSDEQDPTGAGHPVYTFLRAVTQVGYRREGERYLRRGLPPVEFGYALPVVEDAVEEVDAASLENLPVGVDGAAYRWTDLHGEGVPGVLTEQANAWFYKRNLSPASERPVEFAPPELVAVKPNLSLAGGAQFMDLAGDGLPDLLMPDGPVPGLYEHDDAEGWQPFRPFEARLNRDTRDPNLKFVDLDGDGRADVLVSEDDAFVWHASLAEAGFGPARRVAQSPDEERGPRLVFADGTQSIYLADLSGDGLTDLVRVRNGEVCYWPNLGYGRFGAKVTMDHAPYFDNPDQFDHRRIRLADIDGTGTTDIIYLHRDGVRLYFNQSGNSWSDARVLGVAPRVDDLTSIEPADLSGNGTVCLVWSSPLPRDAGRPMRYVRLTGGRKPHLLNRVVNNLGAETVVHYAPSTKFYLRDRRDGRPWATRLPFPVHVVERVETYDRISRNRFVTRYAYHHGHFDGEEREFRGFGMVEQWDTEEIGALAGEGAPSAATNYDPASDVPPTRTVTWFHTGAYVNRQRVSRQFEAEYYREPDASEEEFQSRLLPDTVLPATLTLEEEREACRALKGMMLRREVYADDAPSGSSEAVIRRAKTPYSVVEQNFTLRPVQPRADNRHAVFFAHPREAITYHYERDPEDPRIRHALTLEVDDFGNVLREAAVGYGRHRPGDALPLRADRDKQTQALVTYTEHRFTNAVGNISTHPDEYRAPLPCESRTYQLTGYGPETDAARFGFDEWARDGFALAASADEIPYEKPPDNGTRQRRLIEHVRTLYREDDLTALLPLGELKPLALPGESYRLAFTPGLLTRAFERDGETLLPDLDAVLGGQGADECGYLDSRTLREQLLFPQDASHTLWTRSDEDGHRWLPSGRVLLSADSNDTAAGERAYAQQSFFLPRRYRDPFHVESFVEYDAYNLLPLETRDALGNRVTAGERPPDGTLGPSMPANDYRVLQPRLLTDANGNRTEVAFDALGMVVGTAVKGKPEESLGDSLEGFGADLSDDDILEHFADPLADPHAILGRATTRLVYDLFAYRRTKERPDPQPSAVYTLARETHDAEPDDGKRTRVQHSFSYSDGFGREIQKRMQAEPGPLVEGGPRVEPRWVVSGWTIYNNKGKPVRKYEPLFGDTHRFEFGTEFGVSVTLFYDPVGRVVVTLYPQHSYEKVVFDPWRQKTYDVNDTVMFDPSADDDVKGFFVKPDNTPRVPAREYKPTWYERRVGNPPGDPERDAAEKAAAHADTPTVAHLDALGRPFLTFADNGPDPALSGRHLLFAARVELDIEGNQREVLDAKGRAVMRYDYDMLGTRIRQSSMEAGERRTLNDVTGKPVRAWDDRGFRRRIVYDELRRPTGLYVAEGGTERLAERTVYGESRGAADNHRTRVFQVFDGAGVVTSEAYDFKGNLLRSRRDLSRDYKGEVDWQQNPTPDGGTFDSGTAFDALNRPLAVTSPDGSVYRPTFNEANLLDRVEVSLRGATTAAPFVTNIDYDAKGRRERVAYANGALTVYKYDHDTFRLTRLKTTRPAGPDGVASQIFADPSVVQDLRYTYDPAGNITRVEDSALATVFHDGEAVGPVCEYRYDALYRLVEAGGREHIGQTAFELNPPGGDHRDYQFAGRRAHPNDLRALRNYTEHYDYDEVGNFTAVRHVAKGDGWTRRYFYEAESQLEAARQSNRLTRTTLGNGVSYVESYSHDAHGNIISMNHLPEMLWDFKDQLQQVDLRGGGTAFYVYDASGQRVRKVTESQHGSPRSERVYVGGFEVYREFEGGFDDVKLRRETLHVVDDKQRIALVETQTIGDGNDIVDPIPLQRYQLGNHLGSSSVELSAEGSLTSYEEFHPYGTTAFQVTRGSAEASQKRYRYTGKERDEESGLYYHGARYYAAWFGRWVSPDSPISSLMKQYKGSSIHRSTYEYVSGRPTIMLDPDGREGRIFVLQEQSKQVLGDLHRGLNSTPKDRPADVKLGIPRRDETALVEGPQEADRSQLVELKLGTGRLESNVLIIKLQSREPTTAVEFKGQKFSASDLTFSASGQQILGEGKTLLSPDLTSKLPGDALEEATAGHNKRSSGIPGWTVVIYRDTQMNAESGNHVLSFSDIDPTKPTTAIEAADTSVTLLHELFVHAVPSAQSGNPNVHQNPRFEEGRSSLSFPSQYVVPEEKTKAVDAQAEQNARRNLGLRRSARPE
jgi:RHS repeat-associated protein